MASRIWTWAAIAMVAAGAAFAVGTACDDGGGNGTGSCEQLLCQEGSRSCCDPPYAGTWVPMSPLGPYCECPPPPDDGGADGDGDVAADADADPGEDGGAETETEGGDPCETYPCGPYGLELGNVLRDYQFRPVTTSASDMAGADGVFDFHDIYAQTTSRGGELKGMLMWVTSVWCPVCATEAPQLETLYQNLRDQGILLLGVILDGATPGRAATEAEGRNYASRYGWTFPTVIMPASGTGADFELNWWPPDSRAEPGVPLHVFMDLTQMRLYGRFAGFAGMGPPRTVLTEIATAPSWSAPGVREPNFDCAPGVGTENEPNDAPTSAVNGTTRPFTMGGVSCPMTVADGLLLDQDLVNLGTLTAGTVIDVTMTTDPGTPTYPFFELIPATSSLGYPTMGPAFMGADSVNRQWVIYTTGQYFLAALDGRLQSTFYYGAGTPPASDECCQGGAEYTYDLAVSGFTLEVTDGAVVSGTPAAGSLVDGALDVRSLDVISGTAYAVRMTAASTDQLDPWLVVYDPDTSTVIGQNDDEASGNLNSLVRFTASATKTLYVVAAYYAAHYNGGAPAYTIAVE